MIYLFTTAAHSYTADGFRFLADRRPPLKQKSYGWLFRQNGLCLATAIFTDFDRLNYEQHRRADWIAAKMTEAGVRVLNRPAQVRGRFELLRSLHDTGRNPYQVWRAEERPRMPAARFPVFLKSEGAHSQPYGGLIGSQAELDAAIENLPGSGAPLAHVLVTQFCNVEIRPGIWRRCTSYRVGGQCFPGLPIVEDNPFVKWGKYGLATESDFADALAFWREDPHADWVREMFEAARIDYGRADYTVVNGKPVLFEINTNPNIPYRHRSRDGAYLQASRSTQRLVARMVGGLDGKDREVDLVKVNRRNVLI